MDSDHDMQFAHEKLVVYHKILSFIGSVEEWLPNWEKKHAFVDHLARASESILSNLVQAVRLRSAAGKQRNADYSVGSVMECAACMDITHLKGLFNAEEAHRNKGQLLEMVRMLIGLRKSWDTACVAEVGDSYGRPSSSEFVETAFHHESLDVYRFALDFYGWFLQQDIAVELAGSFERRIDQFATCILLNVAEGNGRFSVLEQSGFLDTANSAAAKASAYLDIGVQKGVWGIENVSKPKRLLVRIGRITARRL